MKQFAEKLIKRNYTKRMLAILIAAVVLLTAVAVLIPVTSRAQGENSDAVRYLSTHIEGNVIHLGSFGVCLLYPGIRICTICH